MAGWVVLWQGVTVVLLVVAIVVLRVVANVVRVANVWVPLLVVVVVVVIRVVPLFILTMVVTSHQGSCSNCNGTRHAHRKQLHFKQLLSSKSCGVPGSATTVNFRAAAAQGH